MKTARKRVTRFLSCPLTYLVILLSPSILKAQVFQSYFYAPKGKELIVSFRGVLQTPFKTVDQIKSLSETERKAFVAKDLEPTLKFLNGPLIHRSFGGIRKTLLISPRWEEAIKNERGVQLPFDYQGQWLVELAYLDRPTQELPLPLHRNFLKTRNWKRCTDSNHSSESIFWYYWDPSRLNCDHKLDEHFQLIQLHFSSQTQATVRSYPEYQNMIQIKNGQPTMAWTFAFGYYEEPNSFQPETDTDVGAQEYQYFLKELRKLLPSDATESDIKQSLYKSTYGTDLVIGHRFEFQRDSIRYEIKVVINADIDQMILFARSYAFEHDSYFGWLGHSRVGSGFDASRFIQIVKNSPELYSISKNYQIIYWGGCNSYTYYTEPFFKMKAEADPEDPTGTKNLDIIANGLPSYFGLNSANALIHLNTLLNWRVPTSYQDLLGQMELRAGLFGTTVLAVVLGDEDNIKIP